MNLEIDFSEVQKLSLWMNNVYDLIHYAAKDYLVTYELVETQSAHDSSPTYKSKVQKYKRLSLFQRYCRNICFSDLNVCFYFTHLHPIGKMACTVSFAYIIQLIVHVVFKRHTFIHFVHLQLFK